MFIYYDHKTTFVVNIIREKSLAFRIMKKRTRYPDIEKRLKLWRSCRKSFCYDCLTMKYYLVNVMARFTGHDLRTNRRETR